MIVDEPTLQTSSGREVLLGLYTIVTSLLAFDYRIEMQNDKLVIDPRVSDELYSLLENSPNDVLAVVEDFGKDCH